MKNQTRIDELLNKITLSNEERQELQVLLENPMKEHINENFKDVLNVRFWEFLVMWIKFNSRNAALEAFEQIGKPPLHLFIECDKDSWELLLLVDDYIYDIMKLGNSIDDSQTVLVPVEAK